jgi:hypothetical protein
MTWIFLEHVVSSEPNGHDTVGELRKLCGNAEACIRTREDQ